MKKKLTHWDYPLSRWFRTKNYILYAILIVGLVLSHYFGYPNSLPLLWGEAICGVALALLVAWFIRDVVIKLTGWYVSIGQVFPKREEYKLLDKYGLKDMSLIFYTLFLALILYLELK